MGLRLGSVELDAAYLEPCAPIGRVGDGYLPVV
jgi:hypothetical protein